MKRKLTGLPNIGKELEKKLIRIGINTPKQLKATGSKDVFVKIKTIDENACINMLMALEGAIQEIRWHNLDQNTKDELREFFRLFK